MMTKNLRGFTLIELVLNSIIAIIVIAFITSFFLNTIISKQQFLMREELDYSTQFSHDQILHYLKQATTIDLANSTLGGSPGKLTFSTGNSSINPVVIDTSNGNLRVKRSTGTAQSIITGRAKVSNLTFTYSTPNNSSGIITGSYTLQSLNESTLQRTEHFSVNLRTNTP